MRSLILRAAARGISRVPSPKRLLAINGAMLCAWLPLQAAATRAAGAGDNPLDREIGRSEVRVLSSSFSLKRTGLTFQQISLVERLRQLGYRRVRGQLPAVAGEFFWGYEHFWIYRRGYFRAARWQAAKLLDVRLEKTTGRIQSVLNENGGSVRGEAAVLEPMLLAESLRPNRAARLPLELDQLPELVWRSVLAAEDARFFEHVGLDSRSLARALLANAKTGRVSQGGSTITQQLIKLRDLTPKRTPGRKISEAVRALALEAKVNKRDILENYLNSVYFGHLDGIEIYGLGAAARAYFSVNVRDLNLAQASLLAGLLQSPNRFSPLRHPDSALERRRYVLRRLQELEWADPVQLTAIARRTKLKLNPSVPSPMASAGLLSAILADVGPVARSRLAARRGVVVETHLDPWLQARAEQLMRAGGSRRALQGAFAAGDARSGKIVAYVGSTSSDPADQLDRVKSAHRQPGSTVKPLVVMEALESCGTRRPLTLATLVSDSQITIEMPNGQWRPRNADRKSHGVVDVRRTLTESLNRPTVRLARYCGFDQVARRFSELGIDGAISSEPAFVLGAIEVSPRKLLDVYSRFAPSPRIRPPRSLVARVLSARGEVFRDSRDRRRSARFVATPAVRFLVRDALKDAAVASGVQLKGGWGKTGTSSGGRDAWFAGGFGDWVAVVWLGRDDGRSADLSGSRYAAPIFQQWIQLAAPLALGDSLKDEAKVRARLVRRTIDDHSGLVLKQSQPGSRQEWFKRGTVPPKRKWWKPGASASVIE